MEEIDLSDRKGLIAMAYGSGSQPLNSSATSVSTVKSNTMKIPLTENQDLENQKKKKSHVSCTNSTAFLLFLIALAACGLSALISYWLTKQSLDHAADVQPFIPDPRYNITQLTALEDIEEEGSDGPSAEELRLPKDLVPIWYNLTLQTYLPGFTDIPMEKNMTYSASVTIKMLVVNPTNEIVLSSYELNFPEEADKYKLMMDTDSVMRFRRETNETEAEDEALIRNGTESFATDINVTETATTPENDNTEETSASTDAPEVTTERSNSIPVGPVAPTGPVEISIKVVDIQINATTEKVTFKLSEELPPGQHVYFKLSFRGAIRTSLNGMYQSTYTTMDGQKKFIAVTQMQPTYARRFVPCFDEPHLKAVWRVKVIHPTGSTACSNAIEEKSSVPMKATDDWVSTTFAETLPISSYLLAVAVTDFEYAETNTKRGTRFRIWSRSDAINQTKYALQAGVTVLEFYEDYYQIPFPMPKQDMFALPDFEAGAMENMGLITYRESALLYDPSVYTLSDKKDVALTVAHELAHQWFGDLVTMKWWDDLWLNEGFATFVEYIGSDAISNEDLRMKDYFIAESQWKAFIRDARSTSHPLSFKITKAYEVEDAFDTISYDKGAAILKMIQAVLGEEQFKKGIEIYLNRHKYQNAEADDLWKALGEAAPEQLKDWSGEKFDVANFADKWTKQMGYPVIEVYRIDPKTIEITQKRFKTDALTPENAKYRNAPYWYKWDVPLWMEIDGKSNSMQWLHEALRLNMTEEKLLIINPDSIGFYRVNYHQRGWEKIVEQLKNDLTKISTSARARLIDDAFALAEANQLPYEVPFDVCAYMDKETELLPWLSALRGFSHVLYLFDDAPESEGIRTFLTEKLGPLFSRIDFKNLDFTEDKQLFESILTERAIAQYCDLRVVNCTSKLVEIFQNGLLDACKDGEYVSQCSKVPPSIRSAVYCEGILSSTEEVYEKVKQMYLKENVAIEKERLMNALGCSRDTYTLKRLLKTAITPNDTTIRSQDIHGVFSSARTNQVGSKIVFDFIQDNWKDIHETYSDSTWVIRDIIENGIAITTDRKMKELQNFLDSHRSSTRKQASFQRLLERARTNINWLSNHKQKLVDYFKSLKKTEL